MGKAKATRVLITGGAGYLGSIMTRHLLENGFAVTVLDSFIYRQNSLLDCCGFDGFSVRRGDARDERLVKELLRDADVLIPLAALVGAPLCDRDPIGAKTTNQGAVEMLCRLASKAQRVLIPNTNSGYGIGQKGKLCTEESPLRPISFYGVTKVAAEKAALDRGNAVSFRLATVFGASPRMRTDLLVNDFVHRAVRDRAVVIFEGHFKRNYVHVRDVARVFLHAIQNFEKMKDNVYNVGLDDANLSKLELCAEIKKAVPGFVYLEAPIGEDPDKRDYVVSNAKVRATGFRPQHGLSYGIRELLKCFQVLPGSPYGNL